MLLDKIKYSDFIKQIDNNILFLFQNTKKSQQKITSFIDKILYTQLKPNYTRSKFLIDIFNKFNINPEIINNNKKLIIDFCVIIELLNIAYKVHDLIKDNNGAQINISKLHSIDLEQTVLIGDLIFTLAFEQMSKIGIIEIYHHFADTTQNMALAEANLLEFKNIKKVTIENQAHLDEINTLIAQKHWPLFNSLLFILDFLSLNTEQIKQWVKSYHLEYSAQQAQLFLEVC